MYIGHTKSTIKQLGEPYVEFAGWLYLPKKQLLLSFEKQLCQSITPLA